MLIKKPTEIPASEVTPKQLYVNRRKFLVGAAVAGAAAATGLSLRKIASPTAVAEANAAPPPDPGEAFTDVWADGGSAWRT